MNAKEWAEECIFIRETTDSLFAGTDPLTNFSGKPSVFMRYCAMQRDAATRDGYPAASAYIADCFTDLFDHGYRVEE